MRLGNSRT
ncbi:hypothetical protein LINPERPRIM_LOCUS4490 [Linum perenne]